MHWQYGSDWPAEPDSFLASIAFRALTFMELARPSKSVNVHYNSEYSKLHRSWKLSIEKLELYISRFVNKKNKQWTILSIIAETQGVSTGFQLMAPALPRSRASSFWMSSSVNSKLYRFAFEWMREGVELFGSGTKLRGRYRIRLLVEIGGKRTHPFWRDQRNNIWAGSRSYFLFCFDHWSTIVDILGQCTYLCCKRSNGRIIHLSSDNRTICLYNDVVLVAIFDYFLLLKEGM